MNKHTPRSGHTRVAGRLDCARLLVSDEAAEFTADDIKDRGLQKGKGRQKAAFSSNLSPIQSETTNPGKQQLVVQSAICKREHYFKLK